MAEISMLWRFAVFFGLLLLLGFSERLVPARKSQLSWRRIVKHSVFLLLGNALVKLLLPIGLIGVAIIAQQQGIGLMHLGVFDGQGISVLSQGGLQILLFVGSLIVFDGLIYLQHVASHRWQWLWQLHRVHHSDPQLDVSTALRFHPLEILLSVLYKAGCILLFGLSPLAVIAFEVLLNACAMFNHANIKLNARLESALRYVIVTPDMHSIHHSQQRQHSDANYGFCLSIWDRCFATYIDTVETELIIGQENESASTHQSLSALLLRPFKSV